MLELSKKNRLPLYIVGSVLLIVLLVFIVIKLTFSSLLSNDVEVETDTDLTYYLDVLYDGVDKYGIASSDSATSEIKSGYILVEDKIPEGLTFTGFVTTDDGTIGAVSRSDATTCYGSVVDDTNESGNVGVWNAGNTEFTYHGLHYDKQSNKVSFKVKNLKAGCKLTVGIITRTPNAVDDPNTTEVEDRRDFYNFASGREDSLSVNSNTVHAYMGLYNATLYNVTYEYEGTVPQGAIDVLPSTQSYGENAKVSLAKNIDIEGYTFSGWSNESLTITNDTFVMPNQNVTLKGSFTEKTKNTVTYILTGTTTPEDYVLPREKYYYPDSYVKLDSLKQGDVLDGYRFLGWESEDVDTSEEEFVMPNKSVILMGEFEQAKYKVTYAFYDTVLPPNSSSLLPEEQEYIEGEIVNLETVNNPSGYEFLGWYHEDNFEMPKEDITIYGEWREVTGEFEVEIEKEILNIQDYYEAGDTVNFKITVTNPNNFALNDVIVKELNDDTLYSASANYNISSSHFVTIPSLSANSSIEIFASYTMKNDDVIVINTAEVTGALAENGYTLKDEDYTSSVQFGISPKIKVCKTVNGASLQNNFQFKITNSTNTFETYIVLNEDECKEINVVPGSYKVKEILNQEYEIVSVSGDVTLDNSLFTITQGQTKQINYTNKLKNKGFLHSSGSVDNKIYGMKTIHAVFDEGGNVNVKIKKLLLNDDSVTMETELPNITSIQKSNALKEGLTSENIVSSSTSELPIYMWTEGTTLYWYSLDPTPTLNDRASDMLNNFADLTDISGITNWDISNSTSMGAFFKNCSQLSNFTPITNWDVSNIKSLSSVFYGCTSLTNLDFLENWNTQNVIRTFYMFLDCTNLEDISGISNFDMSNVTDVTSMFQGCSKLQNIDSVSNWDMSNVENFSQMFRSTNLTSLSAISSWNVSKATSFERIFYGIQSASVNHSKAAAFRRIRPHESLSHALPTQSLPTVS